MRLKCFAKISLQTFTKRGKLERWKKKNCGKPFDSPHHFGPPNKPTILSPRAMGSDKKRKRPQDADPGPARESGTKKSPATANKRLRPEPSAAASKPEVAKQSTLRASKDEEASFPRGGGSILTPLEFKQISNDAAKDVLFETENVKAKSTKKKPMREGLRGDKKAKKDESKKGEQKGIKAEGLSYKVGLFSSKIRTTRC